MSKLFKKRREELGWNIADVAAATRIKESALIAIEEEDYDKLPIEVYARGYIREYAKHLGISADEGLIAYVKYIDKKAASAEMTDASRIQQKPVKPESSSIKKAKEKPVAKPDHVYEKAGVSSELPKQRVEGKSGMSGLIWKMSLLIVVIAALAYQFISSRNAEKESQVSPLAQQMQQQPQSMAENTATVPGPAVLQTPPVNDEAKSAEPGLERKLHELVISAAETSWVQVISDGSNKKEALMKPGESLTFSATRVMHVLLGNAGGVSLRYDGKELPTGKEGEVLRLRLPDRATGETGEVSSEAVISKLPQVVKPEPNESERQGTDARQKASENRLPDAPASKIAP